jgi:hypothetical protein
MEWLAQNKSINNVCGLFSFQGRVTPMKEIDAEMSKESVRINSAHYKCQIYDVLPPKIYRS